MADTPETPLQTGGAIEPGNPQAIVTMLDQATNQQRTGAYAESIFRALTAQASVLDRLMPTPDEESPQPSAVGFAVIDEQAQIAIRTVRPYREERDPCLQGVR